MNDTLMILLVLAFFAINLGFVALCERLMESAAS